MSRVLVVEDAPNWQREFKRILENAGLKVFLAVSTLEVLEALLKHGVPSAIVIDMSLIGGNHEDRKGLEIMERIRGIPVVGVSAYLHPTETESLQKRKLARAFFDKNTFEEDAFVEAVQESVSIHQKEQWTNEKVVAAIDVATAPLKRALTFLIIGYGLIMLEVLAIVLIFLRR